VILELTLKEKTTQRTMFKTVDWGGLTVLNLLAVYAFPPYFVYLMTMAALTASGFLWTVRLTRVQQDRFIEFEKEFRKGHKLEKAGQSKAAIQWYQKLEKRYADLPQASKLAAFQIRNIRSAKSAKAILPPAKKGKTP
jgi:hypothetical protein